jgi:L-threonylcarbamoyladenylate synthase
VSGALKSHYAPQTPIKLVNRAEIMSVARQQLSHTTKKIVCVTHSIDQVSHLQDERIEWVSMPTQPAAYGYALYATMRALDQNHYAFMLWEDVPDTPEWLGIKDRLGRAAAAF